MKLSELLNKQVIDITLGKNIGRINDAILTNDLKIICIIVCMRKTGLAKLFPFLFEEKCEKIPVECIVSIGIDVIIVKATRD